MTHLLRFSLLALLLIAIAAPNASADVDRAKMRVQKSKGPGIGNFIYVLSYDRSAEITGMTPARVCPDSGSECGPTAPVDDSTRRQLRGTVKRVDGGFLVTCEMITPTYELTNGQIVHDKQPMAGMIVGRDQFVVAIEEAGQYEHLRNVVVDYTGCVVDDNLNVTRFVAVR
jgi:hypothetical protein